MSVEQVTMNIQKQLQSIFGEVSLTADGVFKFPFESTVGFGEVHDMGDGLFILNVFAPVLLGVPITNELAHYVATEDHDIGNLRLTPDSDGRTGNLFFQYRLVANDVDPSELRQAVARVVLTANDLDDKLQRRFGGNRMVDN
jgi:hypothetical protein